MGNKLNLEGFSVDEDNVCTAEGGFVGDVTGQVFGSVINYVSDGALDLSGSVSMISSNAASCLMTLADGTPGQKMSIACRIFTSAITITPATFTGGTTLTMSAAGDSVELVFLGEGSAGGWYIIGNNSVVIS